MRRALLLFAFAGALLASATAIAGEAEFEAHLKLGTAAMQRGDYRTASTNYAAALKEAEVFGETDQRFVITITILANAYVHHGRYAEAEPLLRRSLSINEKVLGPNHPNLFWTLNTLAGLYGAQGRYAEAEPLLRRGLTIGEKAFGPDHQSVGTMLNSLAVLYLPQGRYAEAEPLIRRSLTISEKALGPDHQGVGTMLTNLATLYQAQGRFAEAEPLYRRGLTIGEKALGPDHPNVGTMLTHLATLYLAQGRFTEAEPLLRRSLTISEKALGPDHPNVGAMLNTLAGLYGARGHYAEAEPLLERSLSINEKAFGPDHPSLGGILFQGAALFMARGRYAEAEPLLRRSLSINEKAFGPDHPSVGATLWGQAHVYARQGRWSEGLPLIRRATSAMATRFAGRGDGDRTAVLAEQRTGSVVFELHVSLLHGAHGGETGAAREGLEVAQLARASDTAEQVARMAARYAAGSDALGQLARTRQDGVARLQAIDTRLVQAASRAPKDRDAAVESRLRTEAEEAKRSLIALDERMEKEFPQYRELTSPRPLALVDAQKLLGAEEALVTLLVSNEESFLWVLRRDAALFEKLAITRRELEALVKKLRAQLDLGADEPERILARPFDVALAHELYRKVLAPGEKLLAGVKHLIVVPDGALSSLPLGVLVTEPAAQGPPSLADHAKVAWLAKKYALTSLPSVGSLRALRAFAKGEPGGDPFLGFGDPVLEGSGDARRRTIAALYSRGAVADANEVRKLARLPETADELKAIAATLRAPADRVRLGAQATEGAVKAADLARYRTLAFATHGLMAGEFKGLAEPALVLTPPEKGNELDDGLLTAGEISQLKLNADWVILSACNTAAPDGTPGADGLSGLAKAFFYAGARSLLVSHWAVSSEASVALTTRMFAEADRGASKAEALRRSMLSLMETPGKPHFAHPAFWAPFVVVGEGNAGWGSAPSAHR